MTHFEQYVREALMMLDGYWPRTTPIRLPDEHRRIVGEIMALYAMQCEFRGAINEANKQG